MSALVIAIAALIFPAGKVLAQAKCLPSAGAASAVYIAFEREVEIEAGKKEVVLRLVNGSACDIVVGALDTSASVVSGDGLRGIKDDEELPDGTRLNLRYFEMELRASGWESVFYNGGCGQVNRIVLPVRSVLFRVPLKTFEHHRNVTTYFNFSGEDPADSEHSATFSWNFVPGL